MYERIDKADIHATDGLLGRWVYIDMGQYPKLAKTLVEKGGYVTVGQFGNKHENRYDAI